MTPSPKSLWFDQALLPSGWARQVRIEIMDGRITAIRPDTPLTPHQARHAIALPGLANLHSHGFQRLMAGQTEWRKPDRTDSFWTWRDRIYETLSRLGPDALEAITALAFIEMLESGFTRVGEFHYVHHDTNGHPYADPAELSHRVLRAAADTGIGLTLLPVFYAHGGFGGLPPSPAQARFHHSPEAYARLIEACRSAAAGQHGHVIGIAPHSLRAVTPEELHAILPLAQGQPIHIHIAEQVAEVEACRAHTGQSPVTWLMANCEVGPDWCLIHATHMTQYETKALARSGAVAGLCPVTEANLGDGLFPAETFMQEGGVWGIGTDSNVRIDAWEELRLLEYGQRLNLKRRNVLNSGGSTGRTLYDFALKGGHRALVGPEAAAGLIEGAPADLISLKATDPLCEGLKGNAVLDALIFARGLVVDQVWVSGKPVVESGRHLHRDRIAAKAATAKASLNS